ncbi:MULTISPECIES: peptidoglycan-binding protein [unclassified Streptomyces]|uniref:peptidoglycan-binding protein n=1 Tax=unclassified Streptomyces TaxID=2593676 RepID=UPI001660C83B|nr:MULTISPECIES: peptidoglycan-binding protein [unclassified Streptomyces]MBD0708750.1 peptidoglycan-binding protein [Streptomyces sp. CBMA291]MBD0714609.1 peptidoglycan-binding protein [Streptomyces sp. CBMA370]
MTDQDTAVAPRTEEDPEPGSPRSRGRRGLLLAAAVVVLGAVVAGGVVLVQRGDGPDAPAAGPRTGTAPVVRTDLVQSERIDGTLGYAGDYQVSAPHGGGIVTWLPDVGATVARGQRAYAVDGVRVPLFYGSTPLYRTLEEGVDDGPDVRVVKRNLKALGYGPQLADDEVFTSGTAEAVRDWQEDQGRERTGEVAPGDLLVEPGAVRVTEVPGIIGAPAEGPLLRLSGTRRVVTVDMPVARQQLARGGAPVTVRLPGGKSTRGKVSRVGTVARASEQGGANRPGATGGGAGGADATVPVEVTLSKPGDVGTLDGAPVQVDFTSERRDDVLAVPVPALLALAEGGYAVETPDGRLLPVTLGVFAQGRVEVSGAGLREGLKVEVPLA